MYKRQLLLYRYVMKPNQDTFFTRSIYNLSHLCATNRRLLPR